MNIEDEQVLIELFYSDVEKPKTLLQCKLPWENFIN